MVKVDRKALVLFAVAVLIVSNLGLWRPSDVSLKDVYSSSLTTTLGTDDATASTVGLFNLSDPREGIVATNGAEEAIVELTAAINEGRGSEVTNLEMVHFVGIHRIRRIDTKYGVVKIPWAFMKATTALAEWYTCVRTLDMANGVAHPDGTPAKPCVGQLAELSELAPPKLSPCFPDSVNEKDATHCSNQHIVIPKGECAFSYLGCIRDSLADQRWNEWFQSVFLPAFAVHSRKNLRPGEGVDDRDVVNKSMHISATCLHVLLTTAPWCGVNTHLFNDWTLNLESGVPPGREKGLRPMLTQSRKRIFIQMSQEQKEPILPSTYDEMSDADINASITVGTEVTSSAHKAPLVSRRWMLKQAVNLFADASKAGRLNKDDLEATSNLRWAVWPENPKASPTAATDHASWYVYNGTAISPYQPLNAPQLLSASDFLPMETLDEHPKYGYVYMKRVATKYPVIAAFRRDSPLLQRGERPNRNRLFDGNGNTIGFHVCIFGALRNFSSTVGVIRSRYLDTMKPQRVHVVTNDVGLNDFGSRLMRDKNESEDSFAQRSAERTAIARARMFNSYLDMLPFASTLLAVPTGITKKNECLNCRGSFMKELSRMTLLSELQRNYAVEVVFLFRPDAFPLLPITLEPIFPEDEQSSRQGSLMGYHRDDREKHEVMPGEKKSPSSTSRVPPLEDADIIRYRLNATDYPFTIVRDRGFVPTMFAYINEVNITKNTILFHTRVTFGIDLGWTADPVVMGHWHVVNHWLQHFSTTMGSATDLWDEKQPGEKHQYRFYAKYVQPMFKFGVEAGVLTHALDVRVFDFMFSLYRRNPMINYNLFALPTNFAAYQEMTITRDHPTKYQEGACKHYRFIPVTVNLTQEYAKKGMLSWNGMIGRVAFDSMPMDMCKRAPTPPGLPTCYPPFVRVPLSSRNAFKAPCAPFCGHSNLMAIEGICMYVGKQGKHPARFGKPNMATYSESPMSRSSAEGEIQRFNVVFPHTVRRRAPYDTSPYHYGDAIDNSTL